MLNGIKILIILTSHATIGQHGQPTGVWFEELTTPYYAFIDAGAQVELASIQGGVVPVDPHSKAEGHRPASVERFMQDSAAMHKLTHSSKVDQVDVASYAAVFLPGGHGTMWDLPTSQPLADLLGKAWAEGKVLSAVCHGPAGLTAVKDTNGQPLVAGRRVSAFTNSEEIQAGMDKTVPFALETRLQALGAHYEKGPDFQPYAVRDGKLITGQNPASSAKVAQLVIDALQGK